MTPDLDLRALRILLAVAERGNMTGAAEDIGITQSAVSQIVQRIEKEIGTPLFDRKHRPLRLTASGVVLARRAKQIISQAEQLIAETRGASIIPELGLGVIDSFAGTVGPAIARHLMGHVARLVLWSGLTVNLSEEFLSRNIQLIIGAEEIRSDENLRQIPLFWEPFILAVPRATAAAGGHVSLEELSRSHPMIRYSARSHTGMQIERYFRRIRINPPWHLEMDSSDSLLDMVAAGVGWAITTPLCMLHGHPNFARVSLAPIPGPQLSREILLTHRLGEYDNLADRVADVALEVLKGQVLPEIERWTPWAARAIASKLASYSQAETGAS